LLCIPNTTRLSSSRTGSPSATTRRKPETSTHSSTYRCISPSPSSSINQPPGIRAEFERIRVARGDEHAALHAVLECLGEVVWQAQRQRAAPDAKLYLDCLARQR